MPEIYEFDAEILQSDEVGAGAFVLFPRDPVACFGKKNQIPVVCEFDGIIYRGSIVNMGLGPCIGVLKSIRQQLGKQRGDLLHVRLWADQEERQVEMPVELAAALTSDHEAADQYRRLSFSHQKEYAQWIAEGKKAETRATRADKAVLMLRQGRNLKG